MADATLTFTLKESSRGLNLAESNPSNRRLRMSYSVFAKVTSEGATPTISQGDLVLRISLTSTESVETRFPRFIETDDAKPSAESNGKTAVANLSVKGLESGFQAWIADAEVPLIFSKNKHQLVSAELLHQGKVVAKTAPRDWNPVPVNQKTTKKLIRKTETFPRLSRLICETRNEGFTVDLSGHNYLESTDDLTRLTDLTEELFCRLAGGCSFLWSTFRADPENSSLYGSFNFKLRELWAFYDYPEAPTEFLGDRDNQRISVANEIWARAITEITCFAPYYGTGTGYYNGDRGTVEIYGDDVDSDEEDDDETLEVRSHLEYDLAEGVSGSTRRKGKFYPIVAACEQLTTLAVLSRGWTIEAPLQPNRPSPTPILTERGLKAGSNSARTYTTMLKPVAGTWVGAGQSEGTAIPANLSGDAFLNWLGNGQLSTPRAATLVTLKDANGTTAFGPGSIAVFSNGSPTGHGFRVEQRDRPTRNVAILPAEVDAHNRYLDWKMAHPGEPDPDFRDHPELRKQPPSETQMIGSHLGDNTGAAHIGTVLRVDKAGKRFQVLDTGALNTGSDPTLWAGLPGLYDYPETTGDMHSTRDPSRGVGLAPVLDASGAGTLYDHVKSVVDCARPLGLMRLIVARRNVSMNADNVNDWLLYASPLLRMYGSEEASKNRATYADLIWSLRDFPARDQVRVIWSVRLPTMRLANAMINEPRTSTVADLVAATKRALLTVAQNAVPNTRGYRTAQTDAQLYVRATDLVAPPNATAGLGDRRAWLIHQQMGAETLATARLMSKFTKVCFDMEVNPDGTVARICALNAHAVATFGYSGKLPQWHEVENGHGSSIHRMQLPLFCESSGSWEPTTAGLVGWRAQVARLRSNVATRLISRFA